MKKWLIALPLLASLIAACGGVLSGGDRIQKGTFEATITETGEVRSVNSKLVVMPQFNWEYGRPKVADMVDEGTRVKKGEYVGMIDTSSVAKELGTRRSELEIYTADYNKLLAEQQTTIKGLEAELKSAEATFRKAIIDTQRVQFESNAQKEISRLEFKIAKIELEKCRETLELQNILNHEELIIQDEKKKQILSAIDKAERTMNNFMLRAPADGMVVHYVHRWRGKTEVGSELRPGHGIIKLPDLSKMKVLTTVNERDATKIKVGQKASVWLDAFPKDEFTGTVTFVSKVCRKKERESKIKVFDVEVLLDDITRIVRPGMTVSCEFLVSQIKDATYVKNECIEEDDGKYYIYLQKGSGKKRVKVELGPKNYEHVVISGEGIKPGDKVVDLSTGEV